MEGGYRLKKCLLSFVVFAFLEGIAMAGSSELLFKVKSYVKGTRERTLVHNYSFTNTGTHTLYLPWYGENPAIIAAKPQGSFRIVKLATHPRSAAGMPAPPQKSNVLDIPPGETKTITTEEVFSSFLIEESDNKIFYYYLKRPGKITLTFCYTIEHMFVEVLKSFIPKNQNFWSARVCAAPTDLDVRILPPK